MKRLILIYNAKSGLLNSAFDFLHKLFSPSTYSCNLCSLTHHNAGMRSSWKSLTNRLEMNIDYYHIDDAPENEVISKSSFPAVFIEEEGKIQLLISAAEINQLKKMKELEKLILIKIKEN